MIDPLIVTVFVNPVKQAFSFEKALISHQGFHIIIVSVCQRDIHFRITRKTTHGMLQNEPAFGP